MKKCSFLNIQPENKKKETNKSTNKVTKKLKYQFKAVGI